MGERKVVEMMKKSIFLLLILTIIVVCNMGVAQVLDEAGCPTYEQFLLVPWEDLTHDHDGYGMHTHEDAVKSWHSDTCHMYDSRPEALSHDGGDSYRGRTRTPQPEDDPDFHKNLTPAELDKLPYNSREFLKTLPPEQIADLPPETRKALEAPEDDDGEEEYSGPPLSVDLITFTFESLR